MLTAVGEPSKMGRRQLERGTELPERGEGVVVELLQRRAGERIEIGLERRPPAPERIVVRPVRQVTTEQVDRRVDQRATGFGQLRS